MSCGLCRALWEPKEVYQDEPEEVFVILGLGRSKVVTVVARMHGEDPKPREKIAALVALKDVVSQRFGNQYYLGRTSGDHWHFFAKYLKTKVEEEPANG